MPRRSRLLRTRPVRRERPPTWVRVHAYHYRFATRAEFRETGQRWIRTYQREVIGPAGMRAD